MSSNHYDVLEVSHVASQAVIRAAYKSLMQRYHPDRVSDELPAEALSEKAVLINMAYEVLSDPESRISYDREISQASIPELRKATRTIGSMRDSKASVSAYVYVIGFVLVASLASYLFLQKDDLPGKEGKPAIGKIMEKERTPYTENASVRVLPVFFDDVHLPLRNSPDQSSKFGYVHIPIIGLKLTAVDSNDWVRIIELSKDIIQKKIAVRISDSLVDDFLKADADLRLKGIVEEVVLESLEIDRNTKSGVRVEALFPKGFSLE